MRAPDCFIDTNILLYAVSTVPAEAAKTEVARSLIQNTRWGWSAQVAAEFIRAASSKKNSTMSHAEAAKWVELWMAYPMVPVDGTMVLEAAALGDRFQIFHFDSQILVAANRLGCELVYSEDLGHGQRYDEVQVRNPFLSKP
jgi:predicted nucleic acid-binding protein